MCTGRCTGRMCVPSFPSSPPSSCMSLRYDVVISKAHWVQLLMQGSIYVYWAMYWPDVRSFVPFIAAQLLYVSALRRSHQQGALGPAADAGQHLCVLGDVLAGCAFLRSLHRRPASVCLCAAT